VHLDGDDSFDLLALQAVQVGQAQADELVLGDVHFGFDQGVVLFVLVFVDGLTHLVEDVGLGGKSPVELHADQRALGGHSQLVVDVELELVIRDHGGVGFLALSLHRVDHDSLEIAQPVLDVFLRRQIL